MTKCTGLLGALLGHKYESRVSRGSLSEFKAERYSAEALERMIDAARPITYHCDVCTRCGSVINHMDRGGKG